MRWELRECARSMNMLRSSDSRPRPKSDNKWRKTRRPTKSWWRTSSSKVSSKWWRETSSSDVGNRTWRFSKKSRQTLSKGIAILLSVKWRDSKAWSPTKYHALSLSTQLTLKVLRTMKYPELLVVSRSTLRKAELCAHKQSTTELICVSRRPFLPSGTCFSHQWEDQPNDEIPVRIASPVDPYPITNQWSFVDNLSGQLWNFYVYDSWYLSRCNWYLPRQ